MAFLAGAMVVTWFLSWAITNAAAEKMSRNRAAILASLVIVAIALIVGTFTMERARQHEARLIQRRTGEWVKNIPDENVLPMLKSGEYMMAGPGGRVTVITADGRKGTVPEAMLVAALENQGMRLWRPSDEYRGLKGCILAVVLGTGGGATFNLSQTLLVAKGADPDVFRHAAAAWPSLGAPADGGAVFPPGDAGVATVNAALVYVPCTLLWLIAALSKNFFSWIAKSFKGP